MNGTSSETPASDQSKPLVRNNRNCMYQAEPATRAAKSRRPRRESGVVFGSEIMKNEKSRRAPLCNRWRGIANGSPSQSERPRSSAA